MTKSVTLLCLAVLVGLTVGAEGERTARAPTPPPPLSATHLSLEARCRPLHLPTHPFPAPSSFPLSPATEKKTLRSTAAALAAGSDFVFPLRSGLGPLAGGGGGPPPLPPSSRAVDLSALATPGLRLDNTARRSLGLAARLTRLGACTGLGPFVATAPGLLFHTDGGGGGDGARDAPRVEFGLALQEGAPPAASPSAANGTHVARPLAPGDAAALWPGVTGYVLNSGCGPAELLAVFGGDDGGLSFPEAAWLGAPPPAAAPAAGAVGGGARGGQFVDEGCAARCGLRARAPGGGVVVGAAAPAAAPPQAR